MRSAKKNGFTLIELLVTIFLVAVGLIGALAFFTANLNNQIETKNELIAAGLAQEAPEIVRNIADYNVLAGQNWYQNLCGNSGQGNQNCWANDQTVDYRSLDTHARTNLNHKDICLVGNRYRQCDDSSAMFHRKITLTKADMNGNGTYNLNSGDCLKVVSTVTWGDRETKADDVICKPRS